MALELRQNFVSAQYLENKWMDFDQILPMHWYWQHLALDCPFSSIHYRVMALVALDCHQYFVLIYSVSLENWIWHILLTIYYADMIYVGGEGVGVLTTTRVANGQGKVREIWFFFKIREKSGNSQIGQGNFRYQESQGKVGEFHKLSPKLFGMQHF